MSSETERLTSEILTENIEAVFESFLAERRSRRLSPRTIEYYEKGLEPFFEWLADRGKVRMSQIKPNDIRQYLIHLEETGHNPGGMLACYRPIRAICRYWEEETDGEFVAPTRKAKAPKVRIKPLPGIPVEQIKAMIDRIGGRNAKRDEALLRTLFDTAARRQEILDINIEDLDLITGTIQIRHGKGDKARPVFVGRKTRRAIRRYLETRKKLKPEDPLWINEYGERLGVSGLRQILRRRAYDAGLNREPGSHEFRRAAALAMLRNGMDVITLMRQMGHSDLKVTTRYLDQNEDDLRRAHERSSPVDNADF